MNTINGLHWSGKMAIVLLLATFLQWTAHAQTVTISNLEDAFSMALSSNIDYQNYLLNQESAELEYKQAKSYRLPTITGNFSGQKNIDLAVTPLPGEIFGQPGQTINAQFGQEYTYNAGISISKQLFNREAQLQSKISQLNIEITQLESASFEDFLKEKVSLYYYTGLVAQRAVEISEQDLESATQIRVLTKEKYEEGVVDALVFNNAKINENNIKQQLNSNLQLLLQCETELKKLLGLQLSEELLLKGDLLTDLPVVFQLTSDRQLENSSLRLEQAQLQVKASRSVLLPSLTINNYYGRQQFRDDFGLSFGNDSWTNNSYVSLNLSVPIFSGFANRSRVNQSKVNQKIAFNENSQKQQFTALDDQRLLGDYRISLLDLQSSQETFELYDSNKKLTLEKYQEGLISLEVYLGVFDEYLKAENAYLNNLSKSYTYYSQIIPRQL